MAKRLIGYFRPKLTGKETPEEKKRKMFLFTGYVIRQVIDNSNGMFGEVSDEEIWAMLKEDDKKYEEKE